MAFPRIHGDQIDGVPLVWGEAPGPLSVGLVYAVGRADETAATTGLSHVVEHLALSTLVGRELHHNGFVGQTITGFYGSGEPAEIVAFVAEVTSALAELPLDRLDKERQVLLTEEASLGRSSFERLATLRFGARGYGLGGFPDLGLRRLTADEVRAWAAKRFTPGSAAMWLSGPPPDGLSVYGAGAPPSPRRPPPLEPLPSLSTPAFHDASQAGCAMTMVGRRSSALRNGFAILAEKVRRELRHERGLIYDLVSIYDPLTSDDVLLLFGLDPLVEKAREAVFEFLDLFERMRVDGPTVDELEAEIRSLRRGFEEPMALPALLAARARDLLFGAEPRSPEDVLAEAEAVRPEDVAGALDAVAGSLLLEVPAGVDLSDRIPPVRRFDPLPPGSAGGRTFKPRGVRRRSGEVSVDDAGVTLLVDDGEGIRIEFDDCVALVEHAEGVVMLINSAAHVMELNPAAYARGLELRKAITDRVPSDLVIPFGTGAQQRSSTENAASRDLVRRWMVEEELARLPRELDDGENVLLLAEAARSSLSTGLLAVTDRRVMFVKARGKEELHLDEIPRERVTRIRTERDRLTVNGGPGEVLVLKDVVPRERAAEAARHLGLSVPAKPKGVFEWVDVRPTAIAAFALAHALGSTLSVMSVLIAVVSVGDLWGQGRLAKGGERSLLWLSFATIAIAGSAIAVAFLA